MGVIDEFNSYCHLYAKLLLKSAESFFPVSISIGIHSLSLIRSSFQPGFGAISIKDWQNLNSQLKML